jgi:hypothetical protein
LISGTEPEEVKMNRHKTHSKKSGTTVEDLLTGKGGSREGYVAKNEIEDMTLFDEDPGKLSHQGKSKSHKKHPETEDMIDEHAIR